MGNICSCSNDEDMIDTINIIRRNYTSDEDSEDYIVILKVIEDNITFP